MFSTWESLIFRQFEIVVFLQRTLSYNGSLKSHLHCTYTSLIRYNTVKLRSHCTIFRKRLHARADFRHSNPLECSECKIFACRKTLAHAKTGFKPKHPYIAYDVTKRKREVKIPVFATLSFSLISSGFALKASKF